MNVTISNTKPIVPDARQSGPLTREELTPETPAPVFADGVNLTEAAALYFEALAGCETTGIIPGLAEAVNEASTGMLRRDLRILIDLDTKVHEKKGFKTYEAYFTQQTGRKVSRSTIWRRRLSAEFALLLGARGHPELIPSQRQCELLRKNLTRPNAVSLGRPIAEIVEELKGIEAEARETDKALKDILEKIGI